MGRTFLVRPADAQSRPSRPGPLPSADMSQLEAVFANLDRWRHLPNYQLERRADIFFSVFLKGLMEEVTGVVLDDVIIPELPIKRDIVIPNPPMNRSFKLDYLLTARDRSRAYFVELKTDGASRNENQDWYLREARRLGIRAVMGGVCALMRRTEQPEKYHHLASSLARLGYVTMPTDLGEFLHPKRKAGLTERLAMVAVTDLDPPVEVLYVQPTPRGDEACVDFARFAEFVERHDDPLSRVFATHLRKWRDAAGACVPG